MGEALETIQTKLNELNGLMDSYVNNAAASGELTGPDAEKKRQEYMRNTETQAIKLIELFLEDKTKAEAATWGQQEKDDMAKLGLELFEKIESLGKLITPQGAENMDESSEPGPLEAAGRAAAASVMQLLCIIRGFTQLVNFFLIDATLAIVYIIKDKIQKVIHLDKGSYDDVQDAWRQRCG